jgi:hypothetical protein
MLSMVARSACHYAEYGYAGWCIYVWLTIIIVRIVMPGLVMLSVVARSGYAEYVCWV